MINNKLSGQHVHVILDEKHSATEEEEDGALSVTNT